MFNFHWIYWIILVLALIAFIFWAVATRDLTLRTKWGASNGDGDTYDNAAFMGSEAEWNGLKSMQFKCGAALVAAILLILFLKLVINL
jgi:hypothetical protein